MKKILLLIFAVMNLALKAQEFKNGTFIYRITGEKTSEILAADHKMSGNVIIPQNVKFGEKTYTVTAIADTGFIKCQGITSIILPSTICKIGKRAFCRCTNLNSVNIPYSVKKIQEGTFCYCTSLYGVSLPDGITEIGDYAFANCNKITKLNLPDKCKKIGIKAFYNCSKIQALKITAEVESIGLRAFQGCTALVRVETEPENTHFMSKESVLYTKDGKKLVKYPAKKDTQIYTVEPSVNEIIEFAFEDSEYLGIVKLPSGLIEIQNYAFSNCINLQRADIPTTVKKMGEDAFFGCPRLSEQNLHGGIDFIEFKLEEGMIEDLE